MCPVESTFMTPDEYVHLVLQKYSVAAGPQSPVVSTAMFFKVLAEQWAGNALRSVSVAGSFAKGTAVSSSLVGGSDVDLFISLKAENTNTMNELYEMLFRWATEKGWTPKRQNVSIGITSGNIAVDLVPAKYQAGSLEDHTIYVRRGDTWKKTNVLAHMTYVGQSGHLAEIKALKIWKRLHGLDFLSFYVELFAIRALRNRSTTSVAENMRIVLRAIADNLGQWQIVDPANTNNIISDQHTQGEKQKIAAQAAKSLLATNWNQIIW